MAETFREKLHRIDLKCIDENLKYHDLRNLFEAVAPKLSPQDKEEIKKVIQNTDDAETIAAVLQAKAADKNENLQEDSTDQEEYEVFIYGQNRRVKKPLAYFNSEVEAEDFCNDHDWEYTDPETRFVWKMDYRISPKQENDYFLRRNESLQEKLVDAPQEVVDELINILNKYGFVLDDSFKVNPGKTFMGDTHMQVINPESLVDMSDEIDIQDQLQKYVTQDLIDEIHDLDQKSDCPITWNFGPNNKGQITGGLDIMKQYVEESLKEDFSKDGIYDFLDAQGGYSDYNQKIEDVMDEFNLDRDTAEGIVWDWASAQDREPYAYDDLVNESLDLSDYEELTYPLRDGGKNYQLFRKLENGKGKWAAAPMEMGEVKYNDAFEITYDQARGFEPINNIGRLSRDLGKILLPKRESINEASYGGAYDIEDDMYFTKEDMMEFIDELIQKLKDEFGYDFEIYTAGFDTPNDLYIELIDDHGALVDNHVIIDMRRIKTPADLINKYLDSTFKMFKDDFQDVYEDYNSYESSDGSKKVSFDIIVDDEHFTLNDEEADWALEDISAVHISPSDVAVYESTADADYFILTLKDGTKKAWYIHSGMYIPDKEFNESLDDEEEYTDFIKNNINSNKNFDYKKYGKYFDKDGKLIPELEDEFFSIIKTADLSEAYVDADKDILDIIRSDKEYNSNAHVKSHIPDFSAIPNGTVITLKSLNKYHPEVQATIEKISDNNWKYVYSYGDGSWDRDLDNYGVMREINEVDRGAYESLNEAYSIGYVKGHPYNQDMIYSVSIEGPYDNRDGEKYNHVNLTLVCGKDYVDSYEYDGQAWVDAEQFIDDVQFEVLVWYPESESLNDVFEENEYVKCGLPHTIWHYDEEKDTWHREYTNESLKEGKIADNNMDRLDYKSVFTYLNNRLINGVNIADIDINRSNGYKSFLIYLSPDKYNNGGYGYGFDYIPKETSPRNFLHYVENELNDSINEVDEFETESGLDINSKKGKKQYSLWLSRKNAIKYGNESLNELYYGDPDFHRKANIISQIVTRYPDISQREEDYLGDLPYDELVRALKNRGLSFEEPENESLKESSESSIEIGDSVYDPDKDEYYFVSYHPYHKEDKNQFELLNKNKKHVVFIDKGSPRWNRLRLKDKHAFPVNEDYQHKDDEWGDPYTYDEVERELKKITNDFTVEGTIRCYWEQEKEFGEQILSQHFEKVESSDGRTGPGEDMSWVISYSRPKEELKESLSLSMQQQLRRYVNNIIFWMWCNGDKLDIAGEGSTCAKTIADYKKSDYSSLSKYVMDHKQDIFPKDDIIRKIDEYAAKHKNSDEIRKEMIRFYDDYSEKDFTRNLYLKRDDPKLNQSYESLNESVTSNLQDKIIDCLDYFIEMEMEFPKDKFLADSWEDVKDGIQMGIDPEFEVAEGIVEYLKPIITFNKKYNKEVGEEGVFQDEIEMYNELVKEMNKYLTDNGYEPNIK